MLENRKGVYFNRRSQKWTAQYWSKDLKRSIAIGTYDTQEQAIEARSRHITNVYDGLIDDSLPKTKGLPKGIKYVPTGNKYSASVQYVSGKWKNKHHNIYLGVYDTIEEAVEGRKQFILGLL